MALSDFFTQDSGAGGSWADDMDFPSAPAARENTGPKKGDPGYLDSMPDRAARSTSNFPGAPPQREELPLPTVPPFTAFVGNLSYEPDLEEAVRDFFTDLSPSSVRILKDRDGKPKGYGYVEFPSQDTLKEALGRTGAQLQGRSIRVSVAEAPTNRRDALPPSAAEESNQWRRATPLPARTDAPTPARRTSSFSPAEPGPDRDWSAARGARFTPAAPAPSNEFRRDSSGAGRVREPPVPTAADEVDQWRSNKPLVEAKVGSRDLPPHQRGGPESGQSSPGLADTENTWSRGTKLRTPAAEVPPARSSTQSPNEEKDWRSPRATPAASQPGSLDGESPRQPPAPLERRRIQLAPRSVPATPSTASVESNSPSGKSSIFGSAKPVDSAAREAIADAKLAQKEEERKKAREAEIAKKKEEDEKAKAFAEERLNSIKAAQEKAQAQVGGGKPQVQQQQQQQRYPPRERENSGNKRPSHPHPHPNRKGSTEPKKDNDGYEAVTSRKGSANAPTATSATQAPKRDATTRPAFSFAAAARAEGSFVEGSDDVEEAAKGVEEVKI
ncbi:hypothetical protein L486_02285 [Kwoniella mangroviensis CBS 10435]|uniref:RRM domain-containing protein n=1 Tax=Kwoniella mangroviensis CBS 10435 TaxID=1331196 RepID=A0A1B9IVR0_9TREE|nr:hypothetical protein L486_02285 [Kwoniella mangroviensis CBS 10435]